MLSDVEDGGINVIQQKTGKELWVPLHPDLRGALESWTGSPYVTVLEGRALHCGPFQGRMDATDE